MGTRILTNSIAEHVGETITIQGWLHKKRLLGGLNFITLRDRGGLAQSAGQRRVVVAPAI